MLRVQAPCLLYFVVCLIAFGDVGRELLTVALEAQHNTSVIGGVDKIKPCGRPGNDFE
jgi:hypothetical protein